MRLKLSAMKRAKATPAATGRYRVALHGFGEFERNALTFCLKHAAAREPAYVHVERAADADFIVADASHEALATSVTRGARMRDTLFVGEHTPPGARSHVERPIDPEQILRALDEIAAEREAPVSADLPDIVLPMMPRDSDFPTLSEFDIVETMPAAFEHAPVLINLADLEPISRPHARDAAPAPESKPEPVPEPGLESEPSTAPTWREPRAAVSEEMWHTPTRAGAPPEPATPMLEPTAHDDAAPAPATAEPDATVAVAKSDLSLSEAPVAAKKRPMTLAERAEAKAAARRRSRRARLAQGGRAGPQSLRDVLLLGPERADAGLAAQLEAFGFRVHPASSSGDALALISEMPFAAIFLDIAPANDEDMGGLELCMEIKHQRVVLAAAAPPIFLLANRDSAAGRVRAELAGCNALLIRPVTRGDAARALEACDVAMPADERRIERP